MITVTILSSLKQFAKVHKHIRQWHAENALIFAKYTGFYSSKTPVNMHGEI